MFVVVLISEYNLGHDWSIGPVCILLSQRVILGHLFVLERVLGLNFRTSIAWLERDRVFRPEF